MNVQFDPKIGWASIIGLGGFLATLVTIGVMWGQQTADTKAAALAASKAETAVVEISKQSAQRDKIVAEHSVSLAKIETNLTYISPALVRIESKLDAKKP